jgi:endonuclease/exonuclease/phosphatase family metal-dependent hydrolase
LWVDADSHGLTVALKNVGGATQVKILEYNILSTADRNAVASGYPEWEERRDAMLAHLDDIPFDIAAIEEAAPLQVADLYRHYKDRYGIVVADDVSTDALLLYSRARFELIESGRWLLDTEHTHIPRVAVWAALRDVESKREFVAVSVHFDANRIKKQELTTFNDQLQKIASFQVPVLVAGDFNISPADPEYARMLSYGWHDAHDGTLPDPTFPARRPRIRIDHVFYLGSGISSSLWQMQRYENAYNESDHFPVSAWIDIDAAPDQPLGPVAK